ncbi:MAG TPA: ComEC/Rec2 family competence protein [Nitrososphaera sp.]|nr:ComEC/Rec2 family competence protein [Nitrososphaera sp.]
MAGQTPDGTVLTIVFIDVGQGDSTLVILPNSKTLLIDGGERQNSDGVFETLRQYDVDRVDVMVATHPHADHIGGLVEVIDSNVISVGEVLDSGQEYSTQTFEDLLDGIDREHIPLTSVKKGDFIELDPSVSLKVLNPQDPAPRGIEDEVNNNSVVIKLTYGNFSALFTGDMEQYNELVLLNATDGSVATTTAADDARSNDILLDADILKVGHHGSRHSSTSDFLQAVSPETAVISLGAGNSYGHPHREALDRLKAAGVQHVLRTDLDGTITIEASANGEYSVATEKTDMIIVAPEFGGVPYVGIAAMGMVVVIVVILARLGIPWKR